MPKRCVPSTTTRSRTSRPPSTWCPDRWPISRPGSPLDPGAFAAIVAVVDDAEEDGDVDVVGFASLSPFKDRPAYSPTVENSIYVSRSHAGFGIGRKLMDRLIADARDSGFHSMIARVETSGEASLALHRACGFELVGVEKQVGRKFGRWLDVATLQLML